ncbi:30S ribosomal protein S6 [Haliscomenobacter hydrossis]|uniref:Small ribosomal subunit protein bS6 n=1 Tax=Haliscomenobacter hydrossis (strain ATCC 27775 / DSM 1100 / LMG 10767 / O) TaxID=760192 RepID=F4KTB3_HALH1|nr:30S ribosomal protein S6 [Haliscomenobacter hydrossis]AEE51170.1 30S ribosomal protein S6 [Haliscomenobacter hydrossis DSM 1100]
MRNYEVTFIVDPVLASEEIKATAQTYVDLLKSKGCEIVHINEMGLRQLAFAIGKRHSGAYYCVEFKAVDGSMINDFELAFRRDERIIRFLTVALDKYGVKYNEDKRKGLIGTVKKKKVVEERRDDRNDRNDRRGNNSGPRRPNPAPADQEPAVATEPKAE